MSTDLKSVVFSRQNEKTADAMSRQADSRYDFPGHSNDVLFWLVFDDVGWVGGKIIGADRVVVGLLFLSGTTNYAE
jgi:hypothetical protein